MTTIQQIEKAVLKLSPRELTQFRKWFEEKEIESWDKAIESDVKSGQLDKAARQALEDFKQGQFKTL